MIVTPSNGLDNPATQNLQPVRIQFGSSRAVRRGPFIFVSATATAINTITGAVAQPEFAYHQTLRIFSEIARAVEALGGTRGDVMRVRMFVTVDEDNGDVGRALKKAYGDALRCESL